MLENAELIVLHINSVTLIHIHVCHVIIYMKSYKMYNPLYETVYIEQNYLIFFNDGSMYYKDIILSLNSLESLVNILCTAIHLITIT